MVAALSEGVCKIPASATSGCMYARRWSCPSGGREEPAYRPGLSPSLTKQFGWGDPEGASERGDVANADVSLSVLEPVEAYSMDAGCCSQLLLGEAPGET